MWDFLSPGPSHHCLPPLSGLLMGGWAGGGSGAHRLAVEWPALTGVTEETGPVQEVQVGAKDQR